MHPEKRFKSGKNVGMAMATSLPATAVAASWLKANTSQ